MKGRILLPGWLVVLGLWVADGALAASGPTQTPLKVVAMYTNNPSGTIYVAFQAGSMPGCYGNAGGYLFTSNSFYKELYAQLLMMVASGGIRAAVIYTQNPVTNNWSDCTIEGISLQPQ